jgi:hypothetical protein
MEKCGYTKAGIKNLVTVKQPGKQQQFQDE